MKKKSKPSRFEIGELVIIASPILDEDIELRGVIAKVVARTNSVRYSGCWNYQLSVESKYPRKISSFDWEEDELVSGKNYENPVGKELLKEVTV